MTTTTLAPSRDLDQRLGSCIPGGTFELEAFLALADICETTTISSAAVTTGARTRLLVNPRFIARHCVSDEHLFLLVMHELWHVLLAHTRLRTRPTLAENIAFDAIINATLTATFPGAEYRGFFESINSVTEFPGRLLRAPEGWPHAPKYRGHGPRATADILSRLYPPRNEYRWMPTYGELVDLITDWRGYAGLERRERERVSGSGPVLLGDHDGANNSIDPMSDPLLRSVLDGVTGNWPTPPTALELGEIAHAPSNAWIVEPIASYPSTERIMESVLRQACRPARRGDPQHDRVRRPRPVQTLIPCARDRQRLARQHLGVNTLLWNGEVDQTVKVSGRPGSTRVYLDVSGSMMSELPGIIAPLTRFVARGLATAWQFSTDVAPLPLEDLRSGTVDSTGGTALNSVLRHALDDPTTTSVVIVTDGYVEHPAPGLIERLVDRRIEVRSVISAGGHVGMMNLLGPVTKLVGR